MLKSQPKLDGLYTEGIALLTFRLQQPRALIYLRLSSHHSPSDHILTAQFAPITLRSYTYGSVRTYHPQIIYLRLSSHLSPSDHILTAQFAHITLRSYTYGSVHAYHPQIIYLRLSSHLSPSDHIFTAQFTPITLRSYTYGSVRIYRPRITGPAWHMIITYTFLKAVNSGFNSN
ncbi:hypothetical protein DPMN_044738 [Dreissena polymorpha]|uniref:Uncharacterized protein n=1 Tax=Dreissena polymorpha TaxID=45954 RepID=A0A9D4HZ31_DREPO|nr:hypothetical protein DPMN_044738 [Dreissena polymorpha]